MRPGRISYKIISNGWTKSSIFQYGCNRFHITRQTRSVGERSGDQGGQGSIGKAWRQFIATRVVCGLELICWKVSPGCHKRNSNITVVECHDRKAVLSLCWNDYQMSPAIKRHDTPDHKALLWVRVACDSLGIPPPQSLNSTSRNGTWH